MEWKEREADRQDDGPQEHVGHLSLYPGNSCVAVHISHSHVSLGLFLMTPLPRFGLLLSILGEHNTHTHNISFQSE